MKNSFDAEGSFDSCSAPGNVLEKVHMDFQA